ncbi:MAG: membrane protein insertase YidC [Desulfomonilia bacterium]|jgi:YidC/Oxa1 family membrane protein insertase|nr:membrane protein insertase YidC [Deltaproteobacteria bacterium]MDX9760472.1 membrane protein insertase YidC [Desulfomonilia bacterium]
MEKRTLLAIVISIAILLLWNFFFIEPKSPEQPQGQITQTEQREPREQSTVLQVPSQGQDQARQTVSGEAIVVETPRYRAQWSTAGGALTSVQLKEYRENLAPDSPAVETIETPMPMVSVNDQPVDSSIVYEASKRGDSDIPEELIFSAQVSPGITLKKIYTIDPQTYTMGYRTVVENSTSNPVTADVDLYLNGVYPLDEDKDGYAFQGPVLLNGKHLEEFKISKVKKVGVYREFTGEIKWFGFEDKYFLSTIIPAGSPETTLTIKRISEEMVRLTYDTEPFRIEPGSSVERSYEIFSGPKELQTLKSAGNDLRKALYFGFFDIIAKPLLMAMNWIYSFTMSYGWSIIILTIIIKILLYPLTLKSFTSMKGLQKVQPLMKELQAKYKEDKQKLNQEMMKLYKDHKINPMGGCLPMLLQIPILFALYKVFYQAIELRHTPFHLFGTWLPDLSARDPYFITPILMGLSQFVMQKMTPTPGDPTQQKIMLIMPVFFTVLFLRFPSGLVLYWLISNILSIAQQAYINRKLT